ncbi:RND family efflux transporter MFP subunit [Deinococcus grandis]|uniref:RND family efflux transporter MFP subunit n=1 Tax=Deinococcus grandis TaxID=57498 RepID=A0A100HMU7_9DEIO|nr:efflux RND transporter periplasmic adaptor subunit [Deinococcus grandis]BBN94108.1 secretion protein HlyD [Deinococcus grandis]GAQ22385.1 RND family efflux transporter MFP subunit [Deinococcus grandis]
MTTTSPARPAAPRRRWPWVVSGLLLVAAVTGGIVYTRTRSADTAAAPTTTTSRAQPGVVRVSVSGPGTLEAAQTRTVGADLTATVGAVPAVGERVTKGQLITTLSSDTVEQNVQSAQLNLDKARASLDAARASQASSAAQRASSVVSARGSVTQAEQTLADAQRTLSGQRQLAGIGALSASALADAQSAVTKAQQSVDSARAGLSSALTQQQTGASTDAQNLRSQALAVQQAQDSLDAAAQDRADLKVYAPMSGVVSTVTATEGAVVTSGASILTLIDDTTLNLPVQIDETEIAGVKVGQRADVTLDAFDGQTFSGKVVRVSPGATQSSGISVFTATVQLSNPDGQLRAGMTAEAEIIQSEAQGLLVPSKAVQTVRGRSYVQTPGAVAGAEPERVRVETGATDGTNTIVEGGLTPGQDVVVPGTARRAGTSGTGSQGDGQNSRQGGFGGPPGGFPGGAP